MVGTLQDRNCLTLVVGSRGERKEVMKSFAREGEDGDCRQREYSAG
jgi:hypothetical protein